MTFLKSRYEEACHIHFIAYQGTFMKRAKSNSAMRSAVNVKTDTSSNACAKRTHDPPTSTLILKYPFCSMALN